MQYSLNEIEIQLFHNRDLSAGGSVTAPTLKERGEEAGLGSLLMLTCQCVVGPLGGVLNSGGLVRVLKLGRSITNMDFAFLLGS